MADSEVTYSNKLTEILRSKDVDGLRDFLHKEAEARDPEMAAEIDGIPDCDLEVRMYKMILAKSELRDIHSDARRWMKENDVEDRF